LLECIRKSCVGGGITARAKGEIKYIPAYNLTPADYREYHLWMTQLESEVTTMHETVNKAKGYQDQLAELLKKLEGKPEYSQLKKEGEKLPKELKAWDEDMVQRKSTAYDNVENFPNKFTANFMFMMNHGESSIPKINEGTKARYAELMEQWKPLETEGKRLIETAVPTFNKLASEKGVGVLF
jgi:hypothetical protein